jgi:hypothetical protein
MPRSCDAAAGWDWFDGDNGPGPNTDGEDAWQTLAEAAARCFRGEEGRHLLGHLRRATIERALSPDASEARLRHLEGQRHVVRHLEALVAAGRTGGQGARPQLDTNQEESNHD